MKLDPTTGVVDAGLGSIGASIPWLEARLQALGIRIRPGSRLDEAMGKVRLLRAKAEADEAINLGSPEKNQRWFMDAVGVDFLAKALRRGESAGLTGFDEHYTYIAEADPILTGPSGASQTARNKTWELLLASLVSTIASNVTPDEPDVLCSFNGSRLGLAAKVVYSDVINRHLGRVSEGAGQIEDSQAHQGLVVVNLVEKFPHEEMLANFRRGLITQNDQATQIMDVWFEAYMSQHDTRAWYERLRNKPKFLGVLFFVATALPVRGALNSLTGYFHFQGRVVPGKQELVAKFLGDLNRTACMTLSFSGTG